MYNPTMPIDATLSLSELFQRRADEIQDWLTEHAPDIKTEQRHLDERTPERAYWHYGYAAALQDVLRLLANGDQPKM